MAQQPDDFTPGNIEGDAVDCEKIAVGTRKFVYANHARLLKARLNVAAYSLNWKTNFKGGSVAWRGQRNSCKQSIRRRFALTVKGRTAV
jgi:hypothetical protein